jgi:hypothetical protein
MPFVCLLRRIDLGWWNRIAGRWSNHHGGTLGATPPPTEVVPSPTDPANTRPVIGVIYHIGIIDMLTVYDAQKKMAFAAKSIRHNSVIDGTVHACHYSFVAHSLFMIVSN